MPSGVGVKGVAGAKGIALRKTFAYECRIGSHFIGLGTFYLIIGCFNPNKLVAIPFAF